MYQPNPIQSGTDEAQEKDESKVSHKHWPWIVAGVVIGIGILWGQHKEDVKAIHNGDLERIKDSKELAAAWQQVAEERRQLKVATAYLIRYTNDTAIISRIDSIQHAEQSRIWEK